MVQAVVGFLAELLMGIEAECQSAFGARPAASRPGWYARRQGRASSTLRGAGSITGKPA